jgi:hypothetical protein
VLSNARGGDVRVIRQLSAGQELYNPAAAGTFSPCREIRDEARHLATLRTKPERT